MAHKGAVAAVTSTMPLVILSDTFVDDLAWRQWTDFDSFQLLRPYIKNWREIRYRWGR